MGGAGLTAVQDGTRAGFLLSKMPPGSEARKYWMRMPANDPVTGVPWLLPARINTFVDYFKSLQAPHLYYDKLLKLDMRPSHSVREYTEEVR